MNLNRENWIDLLRFPLIVGVVLVHDYNPVRSIGGDVRSLQGISEFADFVMFFISQVVARLSVPLFFIFAGYFFYKKIDCGDISSWLKQFYKRCHSLLIPFLFWNLSLFILFLFLQFFGFNHLVPKAIGVIRDKNLFDVFDLVLGITGYPISYQFWFIRDLFLCVMASVITLYLDAKFFRVILIALLFLWLTGWFDGSIPDVGALLFFCLGGVLCKSYEQLPMPSFNKSILFIYLLLAVVEALFRNSEFRLLFHKVNILIGVFSCYWIAYYFSKFSLIKNSLLKLSSASFFVFAFHEPLLNLVKRVTYSFLDKANTAIVLLIYFGNVVVVVGVSLLVWKFLITYLPKFTSIILGR